jgi:hypothetical protein
MSIFSHSSFAPHAGSTRQQGIVRSDGYLLSPLPNLKGRSAAAIRLVQNRPVIAWRGGGPAGTAKITRDGAELQVCVTADRELEIRLLRLSDNAPALLLIVLFAGAPSPPGHTSFATFDLGRSDFGLLDPADLALLRHRDIAAIDPGAVDGLRATDERPADGGRTAETGTLPEAVPEPSVADLIARAKAAGDRAYYQRRMLQEIEAALEADKSNVASRHVHLANLLARQLRARSLTNL